MGLFSGGDGDGVKSSDFDASLPDNAAEVDAAKDSAKESATEKVYNNHVASEGASSLWESIFGR